MTSTTCTILIGVQQLIKIYVAILLIYAVVSWIPSLRGRWSDYLAMLVEPVLLRIRSFIPPVGGFDIAFLVLIVLLSALESAVVPRMCYFTV